MDKLIVFVFFVVLLSCMVWGAGPVGHWLAVHIELFFAGLWTFISTLFGTLWN